MKSPSICALIMCLFLVHIASAGDNSLLGFSPENAGRQRALEAKFDGLVSKNKADLRDWMKYLASKPHHVGSTFGKETADFIAQQFRSWGYETRIETFEVLFPTPTDRLLERIEPSPFRARLDEPALAEDSTSGISTELLAPYNAYSIDGDVTAPLVYVNYGLPKDYEVLESRGIDVRGKVVIARYGNSWRGIKPKVAAEKGAVGCIIYSDPRDDGFFEGDVYPKGAWRNQHGAQRGSVADMPLYPGDPATPFVGSTNGVRRLERGEIPTLTRIPVLPISYYDALPFLKSLEGPVAPTEWRGALPITYHLGPGPTTVRLKLRFDWKQVPAYNVVATLTGSDRSDQWIIRGNHHDAWVFGADDPISGLIALMAEAKAIGQLKKDGWTPKRTILFAAWDAEEPGLLGSTEWAEAHASELAAHAALYINSDNNGRGFLRMMGSHSLEKWVNGIARDVSDPMKKIPAADRIRAWRLIHGTSDDRRDAQTRADLRIGALGSGSDYTPFLQHLGIASLDLRFTGEDDGGSYHSTYDSFDHYVRFGDPEFEYGVALAQTIGRALLRSANANVLPFEFTNFSETLRKYLQEITKLADDMREETQRFNQWVAANEFEKVSNPAETFVPPKSKQTVPHLNFAPLQNALARLERSAQQFSRAWNQEGNFAWTLDSKTEQALDKVLIQTERALLQKEGLPRRPWYRHQIYAPGFYTGYGVKTFPGVREAVEERRWDEADIQARVAAQAVVRCSEQIDRAVELLSH